MKTNFKWKYLLLLPLLIVNMIIFGVLSLYLLREPICKGQILSSWNTVVALFFPPEDLYNAVLSERIDLYAVDQIQEYEFQAKYIGGYLIVLKPKNDKVADKLRNLRTCDLGIEFEFFNAEGELLSTLVTQKPYGLCSGSLDVAFIKSPDFFPVGHVVHLKSKVVFSDNKLHDYGDFDLRIIKISDL